jgi:ketosteroid isomerase-like protein
MSAAENRVRLEQAFAETARGNGRLFVDLMAGDVTWTMAGDCGWPRRYVGKAAVVGDLLARVGSLLDGPNRCVADAILVDGDRAVVEARGLNRTRQGQAYENRYCFVFVFRDGCVVSVTEYMDTALTERVLPYAPSPSCPAQGRGDDQAVAAAGR